MSEHLLDTTFKDKLQSHASHVPNGLFDKVIAEVNIDAFVKNKIENHSSPVTENQWNNITAALTVDSFIKNKLADYTSPVSNNLWDKIVAERATDAHIKETLYNYESPVAEEVWGKIKEDEERRRFIGWWWFSKYAGWVAVACVIALLAGGYFVLSNNEKVKTTVASNKNNINGRDNKEEKNVIDNADENTHLLPQNKMENNIPTEDVVAGKNPAAVNLNENVGRYNNGNLFNRNNGFIPPQKNNLNTNAMNGNDASSIISSSINNNNDTKEDAELTNKKILPSELYSLNNLSTLSTVKSLSTNKAKGINIVGCPDGSNVDWFIEAYASPDYTMKSITAYGLSDAFLQKKDSTESMRTGFTTGIKLTKRIGDHFILKAGLQYSQINEQFALRTENERKTTTVIVSRTIVRPQGDTTISDTTSVTQIGYRVQKSKNSYHNIELPINVGYEFGKEGSDWRIGINGGVIFNLSSWYMGQTLDTSYNVVSINSKGSTGVYKQSVGVSLYGGMSVIRKVNENLDVFAEPYFRANLSGMTSSVGYNQKFSAAGITIGARMKINNRRQH